MGRPGRGPRSSTPSRSFQGHEGWSWLEGEGSSPHSRVQDTPPVSRRKVRVLVLTLSRSRGRGTRLPAPFPLPRPSRRCSSYRWGL